MKFKANFPCRTLASAVTCALLALAPLVGRPQDAPKQSNHGIVVADMDASVKPGDDFFQYCNGDWIKRAEIPPDRPGVGVFTSLADLSNKATSALSA
jgi:putative endopeptidase